MTPDSGEAICYPKPDDDNGWTSLSDLGTALKRVRGRKLKGKLTDIVARSGMIELRGKSRQHPSS
ncbi:MAG: hypothetical protein HQL37_09885 [Alphaproteobacteria bacterium]|nr:hypothetical protein [Alphaproteobacteria bacterium]